MVQCLYQYLQVYKTFSDAVLLDWFISRTDKDRMSHCDVTYYKFKDGRQNSDDVITIPSFMPTSRTFVLKPLEANSTYSFAMTCQDLMGTRYSTRPMVLYTSKKTKFLAIVMPLALWKLER